MGESDSSKRVLRERMERKRLTISFLKICQIYNFRLIVSRAIRFKKYRDRFSKEREFVT